ncbi:MAG: DinB family protein [Gemmatimonadetes bacterium]|nr:DinB family protein [Gemmatimonadota bacterium]
MADRALSQEIELLLRILDESFTGKGWHGPTLLGSLRGLRPADAAWRPGRGRHSIWELVLHAAYWKYAVRRRLVGGRRGAFPRAGSNWPPAPAEPSARRWREDVALLREEHQRLRDAVRALSPTRLRRRVAGSPWDHGALIYGVAAHDAYHTGQIQLLKRLGAQAR